MKDYQKPYELVRIEYKSPWKVSIDTVEVGWTRRTLKINGKMIISPMSSKRIDQALKMLERDIKKHEK